MENFIELRPAFKCLSRKIHIQECYKRLTKQTLLRSVLNEVVYVLSCVTTIELMLCHSVLRSELYLAMSNCYHKFEVSETASCISRRERKEAKNAKNAAGDTIKDY